MIPYIMLIILICTQYILITGLAIFKNKKRIFVTLTSIEFILFSGFRSFNVGADITPYLNAMTYYRGISFADIFDFSLNPHGYEYGYVLLQKFCAFLNLSNTAFLFIIAIIINVPFFIFIYNESKYPIISVLTYMALGHFSYSLGIFRQMIAISICLLAVNSLKQKRLKRYFILIILASLFHTTALSWIPLYFLSSMDRNKYKVFIIPTAIFGVIFGEKIVEILIKIFPKYNHLVGSIWSIKGGSYGMFILLLFIFLIYTNSLKRMELPLGKINFASISIAIIIQSVSYSFGILGRTLTYYTIFLTILLPDIIYVYFKGKSLILAKFIVILVLIFIFIFGQLYNNYYICPFKFVWQS